MNILTIREATPEDEPEAAEIDRLAAADLRKVYRPTAAAQSQRSAISRHLQRLIAILDGRVVGTVQYRIAAGRLSLLGLGVHPRFRRRGVGTALVRHLEGIGREAGCEAVVLHTVRETGDVQVFQRMGFTIESESLTHLFESDTSSSLYEVVMSKGLDPDGHHVGFTLARCESRRLMQFTLVEEFRLTREERARIRDLLRESFPDTGFAEEGTYLKQLPPRRLLVEENGFLAGQMGVEHRVVRLPDGPATVFGVVDLCVAGPWRSRGLATRMLRWLEELAREHGIEFLVLFADDSRLYERNGFRRPSNRLRWLRIHDQQILGVGDEVVQELMVKELGTRRWPSGGSVDLLGYVF